MKFFNLNDKVNFQNPLNKIKITRTKQLKGGTFAYCAKSLNKSQFVACLFDKK